MFLRVFSRLSTIASDVLSAVILIFFELSFDAQQLIVAPSLRAYNFIF